VKEYFDWTMLLNKKVMKIGPTEEVFIPEYLQATYGGRLAILSDTKSGLLLK
jgi:manganese/zinc/iron transport system ATP- binding protein